MNMSPIEVQRIILLADAAALAPSRANKSSFKGFSLNTSLELSLLASSIGLLLLKIKNLRMMVKLPELLVGGSK